MPLPAETTAPADVTAAFVELVTQTDCAGLPDEVVRSTKHLVLDTLACTIGAVDTAPGRAMLDLKGELGGRPDSTLIGTGLRVPCTSAAYAHAQIANTLDADETLMWAHSACAVVMPAIAVAEMVGASGAQLIAAVAVGFEIGNRVGFSMPAFEVDPVTGLLSRAGTLGFSWASYGAAAAAGKLLGLDRQQLANAFGIAHVSMPAHGSAIAFAGQSEPWHKYSMYAAIAEAGVNAALLAARGYVSDSRVFDTGSAFYRSMGATSSDRSVMTDGLGSSWLVGETTFKPWPACRYIHGVLGAFEELVGRYELKPADIDGIEVTVPPFGFIEMIAASREVNDRLKIMTSLPYALAMVANRIPPGPKWWSDSVFGDPEMHAFGQKVTGVVNPALNEHFLADLNAGRQLSASLVPMELQVRVGDRLLTVSVGRAQGDPGDPRTRWSDAEVAAKVVEYADGILAPGAGAAIVRAGLDLDQAPDLRALMEPCAHHA